MTVVVTGVGYVLSCNLTPYNIIYGSVPSTEVESLGNGLTAYRYDESAATSMIPRKHMRKMDRMSKMATIAVAQAMTDALLPGEMDPDEIGLIMDTGFGSAGAVSRVLAGVFEEEPVVSPLLFPNVVANASAGQAAIAFGLRGPSSTLGGIGGLMYAFDLIDSGRTNCLIVGGCDEITDVYAKALQAEGIAKATPQLGEGAAFIALESKESAIARDVHIYAQIQQVSIASDLAFEPRGLQAYIGEGLDTAVEKIVPHHGNVDWMFGAGIPGTGLHDREQALVHRYAIPHAVWAKQRTGEMFACSNAMNTVLASILLREEASSQTRTTTALVCGYDSTRGQVCTSLFRQVKTTNERGNEA